jgi:hypothetical protein
MTLILQWTLITCGFSTVSDAPIEPTDESCAKLLEYVSTSSISSSYLLFPMLELSFLDKWLELFLDEDDESDAEGSVHEEAKSISLALSLLTVKRHELDSVICTLSGDLVEEKLKNIVDHSVKAVTATDNKFNSALESSSR